MDENAALETFLATPDEGQIGYIVQVEFSFSDELEKKLSRVRRKSKIVFESQFID